MKMKKLSKVEEVLHYLQGMESATLEEIYINVHFGYYANWQKHMGAILSRMVKSGKVERVKPGLFRIAKGQKGPNDQPSLFEQ